MDVLAAWLGLAASGALHGLLPHNGWLPAVLGSPCAARRGHVLRCVLAVGFGHVAAMVACAGLAAAGAEPPGMRWAACAALAAAAAGLAARRPGPLARPLRTAAAALCGFGAATVQGSGGLLLPAVLPLCSTGIAGSGALPALAAVVVHLSCMLATAAAMAACLARRLPPAWALSPRARCAAPAARG